MDPPATYDARIGRSCHLCSSLSGAEGTSELLAIAKRIGLQARWLQAAGTQNEHFDLFGSKIEVARAAGVVEVSRRQSVDLRRNKRKS